MRKLLTLIGAIALLASCNKESTGYTITGETKGLSDGTKVYIEKIDPITGKPIAIDSTEIKSNTFTFKGNTDKIDQNFIAFAKQEERLPFFLENGNLVVNYDVAKAGSNYVTGTKNNDEYTTFNKKSSELLNAISQYETDYHEKYREAEKNNNQEKVDSIFDGYLMLSGKHEKFVEDYIDNNPNSLTTLTYIIGNTYEYTKEEVQERYNKLDTNLKESTIGITFKKTIDAIPDAKVKIGDKAPDFAANSPEGKEISLKESLGKLTIIDFWASWCGPCRAENPNVVALYAKYHDKGLNIIGVSLDKDKAKWVKAIEKDNLTWIHISNLEYWDEPIAKLYDIHAVPATYLLDANGVVVARNLRGKKLEAKVAELLK